MNCTNAWKPKLAAALLALCVNHVVTAQQAKPAKPATNAAAPLASLLGQLAKTDAKAWLARKNAMVLAAKSARADGKKLRVQAKQKHAAAAKETAQAKTLSAEVQKLSSVRTMLAQLTFVDPVGTSAKKKTAQGTLQTAIATLRKLPIAAWDARTSAMRAKAASHEKAAAQLTKASELLIANANKKDASAKVLDGEVNKLADLQKLVGNLDIALLAPARPNGAKPVVVAAAMTAKPAAKKPIAKKPPTKKKPAAKKPTPKKPDAKKAPPKKPPPKKPDAKKAAPKQAPPAKIVVEADKDLLTYADHVYPIFDEYCITCHEPSDPSGGLDLSTHVTTLQGGSSGRTLSPGDPDASRLYLLVSHKEKPTMPPKEDRIDKDLIQTIRTWIQQGAANDLGHARKLAVERSKKRQIALAEAKKRAATAPKSLVVMPETLPEVAKAYPPRPGSLRALASSPSAPLLAVAGFRQVLLMHQDNLRELGVLDFPYGQVECLSFSADGATLIAAGGTPGKAGGAILFDVRTGKELGRFGKSRDVVLSAAVSPNGTLVAVGDTRRKVSVTRVRDGRSLWQEQLEDWATALAFSPDSLLIAAADRAGFVIVREADNGREVHSMKAADGLVSDLAFSPDSTMLATSGGDRSVTLYRMRDGRRLFQQKRHTDQVLCIAWRTANRLVSSGADGRIMQWRTNGANEAQLPRGTDWVYDVAASKDGKRVYTADWLGRLIAIDVKSRKVLATHTPLAATQ